MGEGQKAKGKRQKARWEESHLIPYITQPTLHSFDVDWIKACKMVELEYEEDFMTVVSEVKTLNPGTIISVRVPFSDNVAGTVEELTYAGIEVIHLYADLNGKAFNQTDKKSSIKNASIKDMTLEVHRHLVDLKIRDDVTLIVSGGIAMAEHVPKAIICGADLTAIDLPILFALECRYCKDCQEDLACPVELKDVNPEWGAQRIINLIGAWRNQLLEILGAMGLREVRRLRGEVGRAIFFEDIEKDTFDNVFAMEGGVKS
jgi:glutamate synthase domain-containing protein 2